MNKFGLIVLVGSFLTASSNLHSLNASTILSGLKERTAKSLRNTLEPIAKKFGIDKATFREAAKRAVAKEYTLHEVSPEWRALINQTIQDFDKAKDFDISDIVFLEGEDLKGAGAFALTRLEGLVDVIAVLPIEKMYGTHSAVFGLYHEIGHTYYRHSLKNQLIYYTSQKIPYFLKAILLASLTASLGAALYYDAALILSTLLFALNIPLAIILPDIVAASGVTSPLINETIEKEASLFACEQLVKHGKAQVVLKMLPAVDDESQDYLTQCLLKHKDKISTDQLKNQDQLLFKLVNDNNLEMLKSFLDLGMSSSCKNRFSPLSIAIIYQRFDVVEEFLKHKITLEICNEQDPVVLYALAYNKPEVQALAENYKEFAASPLVQKALDLDIYARPDANSLVRLAGSVLDTIRNNQPDLLELLLKYGADPNFTLPDGRIALGEALLEKNSNSKIIELLLKHGADSYLVYKNKSALELAQENGNPEIIKLIEKYQTTNN